MLVLSRKVGEKLIIANNIVLTLVEIRGRSVRLGIEAPKEISVHREEVYQSINPTKEGNHAERHEAERASHPEGFDPDLAAQ